MFRPLIVLALFLIAATLPASSQAKAFPPDPSLQDRHVAAPAALEITSPAEAPVKASARALNAPPAALQLAQATDERQRGPRSLGAVNNAVDVPSLQCLSAEEARTILQERQLRLGQIHQRPSSACPDGGIVAQSPPRGTTVRAGTTIEVVVTTTGSQPPRGTPPPNAPEQGATVPELAGLTPAEAQTLLRREGLDIGQIRRETAPAPLGTIVAQSPTAGARAAEGSRVDLTVASEVRIPDLRTLSRADAIDKLAESSLKIGRVSEESSSEPNGTVIKQWPLPGVPAAAEDQVDITIAQGQSVPDLRSLTLNDARTRLRETGLRPGRVDSRISDQRRGTIIDQRPAADAVVDQNATVDVVLAATPIVPDLAGRTVEEARRLITEQSLQVGSITTTVTSEPQGTVIEQQPGAETEARPGSSVDLVIAEGIEIPDLTGLTLAEAGAELAKQLMRLGTVERRQDPNGDGRIVAQSPTPGSPAAFGVGIDVTIAEPPTVPDLRGLSADAVATSLTDRQLVLTDVDYQLSTDQPDQTVLSQEPPPGTAIANGGSVSVVLAVTAPPPGRSDLVAVPSVTSLTAAQADQLMKDAGLILQLDGSADGSRPNRVTAQAPIPGRLIPIGSPVTAAIEPIDEVLVPDLQGAVLDTVGTTLADAFLEIGEQEWRLSTQPDGTVINQDPPPGTPVSFGNRVDVVFSASALIPDLTGLTPEEANPVLVSQSLQLGGIQETFSLRWPGTIVDQAPEPDSPARNGSVVKVQVVGLAGPLTAGGTLLLALAGVVWFRARQSAGAVGTTPTPPPVYGIAKSGAASASRPAFKKTTRSARPIATAPAPAPAPRAEPDYIVHADAGTQAIQTDAPSLVKSAIRLRGRTDPGEQTVAIEPS